LICSGKIELQYVCIRRGGEEERGKEWQRDWDLIRQFQTFSSGNLENRSGWTAR